MMKSRWPLAPALALAAITIPSIALAPPAQAEQSKRAKAIVACINKDITASNAEWKLKDEELKKFTEIIDREIQSEKLVKKTPEEQHKIIEDIEKQAKKELPNIPKETIDKMLDHLKVKGKHCATENPE